MPDLRDISAIPNGNEGKKKLRRMKIENTLSSRNFSSLTIFFFIFGDGARSLRHILVRFNLAVLLVFLVSTGRAASRLELFNSILRLDFKRREEIIEKCRTVRGEEGIGEDEGFGKCLHLGHD